MHPTQGGDLVGLIVLASLVRAHGLGQFAANRCMAAIELLRGLDGLSAGAEEHGVDDTKSRMETADWLVQQVGMLSQRGRDPGVSQLQ
jgi:hypothetical protein